MNYIFDVSQDECTKLVQSTMVCVRTASEGRNMNDVANAIQPALSFLIADPRSNRPRNPFSGARAHSKEASSQAKSHFRSFTQKEEASERWNTLSLPPSDEKDPEWFTQMVKAHKKATSKAVEHAEIQEQQQLLEAGLLHRAQHKAAKLRPANAKQALESSRKRKSSRRRTTFRSLKEPITKSRSKMTLRRERKNSSVK